MSLLIHLKADYLRCAPVISSLPGRVLGVVMGITVRETAA